MQRCDIASSEAETRVSTNGSRSNTQMLMSRAFDPKHALWQYETTDDSIEYLWCTARENYATVRGSMVRSVGPSRYVLTSRSSNSSRYRYIESTLSRLLATSRDHRWFPTSHISPSTIVLSDDDAESDAESDADNDAINDETKGESRDSDAASNDDDSDDTGPKNDRISTTRVVDSARCAEVEFLQTMFEWFSRPRVRGDDADRGVHSGDRDSMRWSRDDSIDATPCTVDTLYARQRLLDSLCLDSLFYTVSPTCNRALCKLAARNACKRNDFATAIADFHLDVVVESTTTDERGAEELILPNGERVVEQRVPTTVSQWRANTQDDSAESNPSNRARVDEPMNVDTDDGSIGAMLAKAFM